MTMILRIGKRQGTCLGSGQNGFTLIEVMLSVVLLSVGLVAINQALLKSLSTLAYLQTRGQANSITQNKIWEIQSAAWNQNEAPSRKEDGVLLGTHQAFNYKLQSVTVRGSELLYEIRLAVRWLESGKELGLQRSFYARLPPPPQS